MQQSRNWHEPLLSIATHRSANPSSHVALKVPHSMTTHGDTRIDDYYWMRDDERQDPETLAASRAREPVCRDCSETHRSISRTVVEEIKGRIAKDDNSVPVRKGSYYYSI
ncbi:hypothetical protein OH492_07520 [Vibrio chagasii]|nr:hypothetical protein [Vibrio chagasii]